MSYLLSALPQCFHKIYNPNGLTIGTICEKSYGSSFPILSSFIDDMLRKPNTLLCANYVLTNVSNAIWDFFSLIRLSYTWWRNVYNPQSVIEVKLRFQHYGISPFIGIIWYMHNIFDILEYKDIQKYLFSIETQFSPGEIFCFGVLHPTIAADKDAYTSSGVKRWTGDSVNIT